MADETKAAETKISPYVPDTRAIIVSWMMLSSFIIIVLCWWKPPGADNQLLNTLIGMYVGTGFITAITWWMGSSKGSDANNKMVESLTQAIGPAAAAGQPPVVAWWSLLTDTERAAIQAAAANNPQIAAFVAAAQAGKATKGDLDYLVARGMLTQPRADAIGAS